MNLVEKVRQVTNDIVAAKDPMQVQRDWELVARLLGRLPVDLEEAQRVCRERDAAGLDALVGTAEAPPAEVERPKPEATAEEMRAAMKAYRKRLKVARLADESKLRGRRLTSGKSSEIDAIIPPTEWPRRVWEALVEAGELESAKGGFYALPRQRGSFDEAD